MNNRQWTELEHAAFPEQSEVLEQARREPVLFPDLEAITKDWIRLSYTYQYLFGCFLKERTGLNKLDGRIAQRDIKPASAEQRNYYQKYGNMGLRYFYLRCCARVERLSDEDSRILEEVVSAGEDASLEHALKLIEETFPLVMSVDPSRPETIYEPKQTLHRDYQVKGKEIPLVMRSVADFNLDGSLVSELAENDRIQIFSNIWKQIDGALSKDLDYPVKTAVEVFEL